jgi:hypothetical protein
MNLGWCCMYGIGTVYSFDVLELTPDVSFFFFVRAWNAYRQALLKETYNIPCALELYLRISALFSS